MKKTSSVRPWYGYWDQVKDLIEKKLPGLLDSDVVTGGLIKFMINGVAFDQWRLIRLIIVDTINLIEPIYFNRSPLPIKIDPFLDRSKF